MITENATRIDYLTRITKIQDEYSDQGKLYTMNQEKYSDSEVTMITNVHQTTKLMYSKSQKFMMEQVIFRSDFEIMKHQYKELGMEWAN